MSEDAEYIPEPPETPTHYHGDEVRMLFIAAAVLVFVMRFVGGEFPFSIGATLLLILTLVIAAGISNPVQRWIHSINMIISIAGVVTFSGLTFSRLHSVQDLFSGSGLVAAIALIFLAALYFSVRTVRGFVVPHMEN